jgi:hypothetical protein
MAPSGRAHRRAGWHELIPADHALGYGERGELSLMVAAAGP